MFDFGMSHEEARLKSVSLRGKVGAIALEATLEQAYQNTSKYPLELFYTFPLPQKAVITNVVMTLGGETFEMTVSEAKKAEQKYERELEDGNTVVSIKKSREGLFTAQLGNLLPGDVVKLAIDFVLPHQIVGGDVRIKLPTTIAPRYGYADTHFDSPADIPESDFFVQYPFNAAFEFQDSAASSFASPSHDFKAIRNEGKLSIELDTAEGLDRDVVVDFPLNGAANPGEFVEFDGKVGLISLVQPPVNLTAEKRPLHILLDVSGSMLGEPMETSRLALQKLIRNLPEGAEITFTAFGSTVETYFEHPLRIRPDMFANIDGIFERATSDTLGGTELAKALENVGQRFGKFGGDILLITDGQVWDIDNCLAAILPFELRVFAIGIGAAAVDANLRVLAGKTQGAADYLLNANDLVKGVVGQIGRFTDLGWPNARVAAAVEPIWQSGLEYSVFGNDSELMFALFDSVPDGPLTCELNSAHTSTQIQLSSRNRVSSSVRLKKLFANARLASIDADMAAEFAVKHGLISDYTSAVLLKQNNAFEKPVDFAHQEKVKQQAVSGRSGLGGTNAHVDRYYDYEGLEDDDGGDDTLLSAAIAASNLSRRDADDWSDEISFSQKIGVRCDEGSPFSAGNPDPRFTKKPANPLSEDEFSAFKRLIAKLQKRKHLEVDLQWLFDNGLPEKLLKLGERPQDTWDNSVSADDLSWYLAQHLLDCTFGLRISHKSLNGFVGKTALEDAFSDEALLNVESRWRAVKLLMGLELPKRHMKNLWGLMDG